MSTNNINKIKLQIDCYINNLSDEDRNLELNNNFTIINCYENYDFSDIYKNKEDIASNLSKINNTKSYLKNIYNILFYNKKTQIDFRGIFFQKVFDVNANENVFIEMKFKIDLQYDDISERNYVKTIYQLLDENNNSLYIKSINNNEYSYFSNRVIVDEDIFLNFNKDIKKLNLLLNFRNYYHLELFIYTISKMTIID